MYKPDTCVVLASQMMKAQFYTYIYALILWLCNIYKLNIMFMVYSKNRKLENTFYVFTELFTRYVCTKSVNLHTSENIQQQDEANNYLFVVIQ